MNIFTLLRTEVLNAVGVLAQSGKLDKVPDTARVTVEPPRDAAHGDAATNAAMVLAGQAGMKPRDFANLLARELEKLPAIEKVDVAGPGFINLKLSDAFWYDQLKTILTEKEHYGDSDMKSEAKRS